MSSKPRLIAFYLPQYHPIPENDKWWGEGFTDWVNVKTAQSQHEGHYQPRIPLNNNYYDQSQLETLHWQIDLAKKHGVYGFSHYHYWFDGKQLLETPTNLVLENNYSEPYGANSATGGSPRPARSAWRAVLYAQ